MLGFVECLKNGLQPYSKYDEGPLDCPPFRHLGHIYEEGIRASSIIESEPTGFDQGQKEYAKKAKESAEKELEIIKKDDPDLVSWKWLAKLSDDDFKNLFSYLDEAIFKRDNVLEFEKKHKLIPKKRNLEANHQKVLPFRTATKWKDVKITLINNESVRIDTPQGSERLSYHELGMSDKRSTNKPTMLWFLLKLFAQNQGYISSTNPKYDSKLPDTAKRLNGHLKKLFGINESIFTGHYKAEKGYRTKILFSDQTIAV